MPQSRPLLGAKIHPPEPARHLGKAGLTTGQGEGQHQEPIPAQPPQLLPLPLGHAP